MSTPASRKIVIRGSGVSFLFVLAAIACMFLAALAASGTSIGDTSPWTWFFGSLTAVLISMVVP